MKDKASNFILIVFLILLLLSITLFIYGIISPGTIPSWIGTQEYTNNKGETIVAPKTLWDLMSLLIIPVSLAVIAFLFNRSEKQIEHERLMREKEKEEQRTDDINQETLLREYINTMSVLMTEKALISSEPESPVRIVARTITKVTAHQLTGKRKAVIMRFLKEADLVDINKTVVALAGADFRRAELDNTNLSAINLAGTNFSGASFDRANLTRIIFANSNLSGASLCNTTLRQTKFTRANLSGAEITESHFDGTDLIRADLTKAILCRSVFIDVKLNGADLREANMCGADFSRAKLDGAKLTGAEADVTTTWPENFDAKSNGIVLIGRKD